MKIPVIYFSVCVFQTLASSDTKTEAFSLQVTPSRSQFLQYEHVSLSCQLEAGGGRLKRNTTTRGTESCPYGWGTLSGRTCNISTMYPSDTGLYWCESEAGGQSQTVNIIVTGGSVILESPVLPVMEGDAVTLRCRTTETSFSLTADFYKDGLHVRSSFTENMTLLSVSRSDEGLYKCNIPGAGESAESWLAVRVSDQAVPDAAVMSASRLVCHVVTGTPFLLTTIILGLIYRDQRRASRRVAEDRGHHVVMDVE